MNWLLMADFGATCASILLSIMVVVKLLAREMEWMKRSDRSRRYMEFNGFTLSHNAPHFMDAVQDYICNVLWNDCSGA